MGRVGRHEPLRPVGYHRATFLEGGSDELNYHGWSPLPPRPGIDACPGIALSFEQSSRPGATWCVAGGTGAIEAAWHLVPHVLLDRDYSSHRLRAHDLPAWASAASCESFSASRSRPVPPRGHRLPPNVQPRGGATPGRCVLKRSRARVPGRKRYCSRPPGRRRTTRCGRRCCCCGGTVKPKVGSWRAPSLPGVRPMANARWSGPLRESAVRRGVPR